MRCTFPPSAKDWPLQKQMENPPGTSEAHADQAEAFLPAWESQRRGSRPCPWWCDSRRPCCRNEPPSEHLKCVSFTLAFCIENLTILGGNIILQFYFIFFLNFLFYWLFMILFFFLYIFVLKNGPIQPLFCLFLVFLNKQYNFFNKYMWKNVHPVYGARIQTHNLQNVSLFL